MSSIEIRLEDPSHNASRIVLNNNGQILVREQLHMRERDGWTFLPLLGC